MKDQRKYSGGYIAIASVLVILAVTLVITLSASLLSIDGAQVSLSESQGQNALFTAESCVSEVLIYLSINDELPPSVSLPEGTCSVIENSHSGNNWIFTTTATLNGFSRSIKINVDRTTAIFINQWEEV